MPADLRYKSPEVPPTTAHVLGVFAKELQAEGFSEARIDALLVKTLEHELRADGLNVYSLDEDSEDG